MLMPEGERPVRRNLVLCLDGTSNKYGLNKTNVVKLYEILDRTTADQIAYYQPGIGTMPPPGVWVRIVRWYTKTLDLAIAWLLEDHVCDAYRFLMRFYRPDDAIFIFGFSRGSYTARALAAMIHKVGLLTQGNEELLPFAWATFKGRDNWEEAGGFKKTFSREIRVHFLGLWDTVSSVGWMWEPTHLQYTKDNPEVEVVRHAIALDERRAYFPQNRWTDKPRAGQDVLEAWFPGVHCDVGGGYPEMESGLSKTALRWMVGHAANAGLKIDAAAAARMLPGSDPADRAAPNVAAKIHESLQGFWWIAEYIPKRIKDPAANFATRWIIHGGQHRFVAEGVNIHTSVFERMKQVNTYRPSNLPKSYTTLP
jgi:uncharacterized protein (DUF2235 family)